MIKLRVSRWLACAAITVAFAGLNPAWADDQGISIFSGRDHLRSSWMVSGWGGLQAAEVDEGGRTPGAAFVGTKPDAKAAPYSGVSLNVSYSEDLLGNSIPLTSDLSANGVVEMYLNCGKDLAGNPGGGAKLKIVLTFVTKDGKSVGVPTDEQSPLDSDSTSWELIRIPIAPLLAKIPNASNVAGLCGVGVQYVDAPACEIRVTDCSLKAK